ncbi:hypothetical protein PHLGIDRAFT_129740 [Phlebiopsis gigantea 11061_1 CR5-6]|uniref:MARVEL domain-containing protein n=1 Tax=Phlebiopsis gigantea (strain 11061_1 CR5-6) TaxID=745531 RepID=A0A0C3RTL6_PHLG1|nr:hypothetical protein PHLGIDRAFT_129740 [Phlebiopsis gigantea 11061_1 CR5-6]
MSEAIARTLPMTRLVVLSALSAFSLAVLGSNAHYAWTTMNTQLEVDLIPVWPQSAPDAFSAFNLAVAVISLVTLLTMIIVDVVRRGAFTSWIVVEIGWLGFLLVLWLAASAYTASIYPPVGDLCSANPGISNLTAACTDIQVSMAFSWMGWILVSAYWGTLLAFSIISANKGRPVWKSTVKTADFVAGKAASPEYAMPPMQQQVQPPQAYSASLAYNTPYTPQSYDAPPSGTVYRYTGGAEV